MAISVTIFPRQPGETLYDFLGRREQQLEAQAAAYRGELESIETELAHVKSALRQIGNLTSFGRTPLTPKPDSDTGASAPSAPVVNGLEIAAKAMASNPPTIKDMILKALWTGFRKTGATQAELRQFIRDAYGRDIDRGSMSPQITRLRIEGLLKQKGGEDNWRLTVKAVEKFSTELPYGPDAPSN